MYSDTAHVREPRQGDSMKYERLYNYTFHNNTKFVEGWKKVKHIIPADERLDALIKAQTFFYSREVEPVGPRDYKRWLKDRSLSLPHLEELVKLDEPVMDSEDNACTEHTLSTNHGEVTAASHDKCVCTDDKQQTADSETETAGAEHICPDEGSPKVDSETNTEDNADIGQHPANFGELVYMIQNGIKLADTDELGIEPTNDNPTPGSMSRRQKPWEMG